MEYLDAVDYGHSHLNQWLAIPGNAPAEEPAATEAPATEAPAPATEAPTEAPAAVEPAPADNNGIVSLLVGIAIGAAAAVIFFLLKKKK